MKRFLFLSLLVVSFNSHALYKLGALTTWSQYAAAQCGIVEGGIYSDFSCLVGKKYSTASYATAITSWYTSNAQIRLRYDNGSSWNYLAVYTVVSECNEGDELNPISGACEPPIVCEADYELNPDTYECEAVPFCESSSVIDEFAIQSEACNASGGVFQYSCNELFQTADFACVDKSNCVIGATNWPSCLGDIDPTADIDAPNDSFGSGTADAIDPTAPWQKDEPDEVTPEETTDTAVLTAIQNMNRDQNQALGQISTDMNQGFADTNTALNQLNLTNQAVGQSIVDQMNQDYQMAQAQRQAQTATTAAVMNGTSEITSALGLQTSSLTSAISGNGDKLDAINGSLGDIADLLGTNTDCEPTAENGYCENPHGLTQATSETIYSQMLDSLQTEYDTDEQNLITSAQDRMDDPIAADTRTNVENSTAFLSSILPTPSQCTALTISLPPFIDTSISCEFSVKTKAILSLIFYFFTIYQLVEILLGTVTPVAGTTPYMRR